MDSTILQVPIKKATRDRAVRAADRQGFSSLQEAVRVFLSQLAEEEIRIGFNPPVVRLSDKNDKRYAKMIEDVRGGKVKMRKFTNAEALVNHLNSV